MNGKSENLEMIVSQFLAYRRARTAPPMALFERFREVAIAEAGEKGEVRAGLMHTIALKDEERLEDAIGIFEVLLKRFPEELFLQSEWSQFKRNTLQTIETRLCCNPWDAKAARLYEKFMDLGDVTIRLHVVMIEHYRLVGSVQAAKSLADRVVAVAPNFPGLQETLRRLNQENVRK